MTEVRISQAGTLKSDPKYPRVGIVGDPGLQAELALTREGYHGVITLLNGEAVAACGFPPAMLREIGRLTRAAVLRITPVTVPGTGEIRRVVIDGRLRKEPRYPRIGIVGPAGMQCEVSLDHDHGVITILGGELLCAVGYTEANLEAFAALCDTAANRIDARHGRGEANQA